MKSIKSSKVTFWINCTFSLTLIWVGDGLILPLCWFSLNNSETVKAVTWHFVAFSNTLLETFVPNLVFPTSPSLQIFGKTQTRVFPNSGFLVKSLIKENCHNSRTSDDIDMKLGAGTKLYKRNKTTSKRFDDDVMSKNYDITVIFSIYSQFGAIQKPDSGRRVSKTYVFIVSNLLSYKNWKQN